MRIAHPARSLISFTLDFSSPPPAKPLSFHSLTPKTTERPRRRVFQFSMEKTENVSTTATEDADANYGFNRSEMYKSNLAGTVVLIEKLKEGIESRGLKDKIFVSACSHVGGHKYAGNLIIYSPNSEGKTMGHWYGYVTPEDVPEILDQHIEKGIVIERIWRGQMGLSAEEGERIGEQKLRKGKDKTKSNKHEENSAEAAKDNVASCCQGANGVSCCRDGSSETIKEKKLVENIEGHGKCGLDKLSRWIGSLEQSDVLAAVAVVGAVATIAVACSFYKRSG
ncbi:hypothetical protein D5086_028956 [Populus alba]|uniref:Uncharacterized protein n=1 Tax=Populus alba TaxID=43335 RepID=A0ACC4ASA7_POPAL